MKKELKYFLLGILFTIIIIGIVVGLYFVILKSYKNKGEIEDTKVFHCDVLDNIKMKFNSGFITNDNKFYIVNYDKKFSNDQNCKLTSDIEIISQYNHQLVDKNYNIYYYDYERNTMVKNEFVLEDFFQNSTFVSSSFYSPSNPIDNNYTYYAILETDGNLYSYATKYEYINGKNEIILMKKDLYKSFDGEKILEYEFSRFDYKFLTYIKTDKSYYTAIKTNKDTCEKYADVKCEYGLQKNEYLTNNYNDIAFIEFSPYDSYTIIKKDGTMLEIENN